MVSPRARARVRSRAASKPRKPISFRAIYSTVVYLLVFCVQASFMALLAAASIAAGMNAYGYIFQDEHFLLNKVVVTGNKRISEAEILSLSGVSAGKNSFQLDLENISKNITRNPWVEKALVRRDLPSGLTIEVTERELFARVFWRGELFLVDAKGFIIAKLSEKEYPDLPLLAGAGEERPDLGGQVFPKIFLTGLHLLKYAGETKLFEDPVAGLRIENKYEMSLITRKNKTEIRVDTQDLPKKLSRLRAIFDYARMEGKSIKSIDLCYEKKAVVKFAEGA